MTIVIKIFRRLIRDFFALRLISFKDSIDVMTGKKILAYWSNLEDTKKNFGDALNPFILQYYTGKEVVHSSRVLNLFFRPKIFFIGSILDNFCSYNAIIVGSGIKNRASRIFIKPKHVLAVRGPLTRKKLLERGVDCPEVYCDPALLLNEIIHLSGSEKTYDVGIIPHYADKKILEEIEIIHLGIQYKIIDIELNRMDFIRTLCSCRYVLSSSLHGIIVAHSYGIPALWIKLSDKIAGDDFKFRDYYYSIKEECPVKLEVSNALDLNSAIKLAKSYDINENIIKLKAQITELKKQYFANC